MSTRRSRASYVAVGVEATPGTPATANSMRVLDADFTFPGLEITKSLRDDASSPHGVPGVPALASTAATLELVVPVDVASQERAGSGDPISPPPYDALLQACGYARTDSTADNTASYAPGETMPCTLDWRSDSSRFRMVGCRGTAVLAADSGGDMTWTFSMQGRAETVHQGTQSQRPPATGRAYRRVRPLEAEIMLSQVAPDGTVGSAIAIETALIGAGVDLGVQLTRPGDITAPDGSALPVIVGNRPVQTINTIAPRLAGTNFDDFWTLVNGDGILRVATTFNSPDAGASLQVVLGSAAATAGEMSDADGAVGQQLTASAVALADVPLQLIFTTPAP